MYASRALRRAALVSGRLRSASALQHEAPVQRMATLPHAQSDTQGDETPLSRLEELRLRLQLEQEGMELDAFASTADLEAAAVPVPRGRQKEAKPSWLKHNALKKTDPTTVQGQNYLRLKKDVRRECSAPPCFVFWAFMFRCACRVHRQWYPWWYGRSQTCHCVRGGQVPEHRRMLGWR